MCDLGGGRHPAVGGLMKYERYLPYGLLVVSLFWLPEDGFERTIDCRQ